MGVSGDPPPNPAGVNKQPVHYFPATAETDRGIDQTKTGLVRAGNGHHSMRCCPYLSHGECRSAMGKKSWEWTLCLSKRWRIQRSLRDLTMFSEKICKGVHKTK